MSRDPADRNRCRPSSRPLCPGGLCLILATCGGAQAARAQSVHHRHAPCSSSTFATPHKRELIRPTVPARPVVQPFVAHDTWASRINRWGRALGIGYSDGYHAARPRHTLPTADLPPRPTHDLAPRHGGFHVWPAADSGYRYDPPEWFAPSTSPAARPAPGDVDPATSAEPPAVHLPPARGARDLAPPTPISGPSPPERRLGPPRRPGMREVLPTPPGEPPALRRDPIDARPGEQPARRPATDPALPSTPDAAGAADPAATPAPQTPDHGDATPPSLRQPSPEPADPPPGSLLPGGIDPYRDLDIDPLEEFRGSVTTPPSARRYVPWHLRR